MPEIFARKNDYDKNGTLLSSSDNLLKNKIPLVVETLRDKINISNEGIFTSSEMILNTIINESKTNPWIFYVSALEYYIEWLFTHSVDVAVISLMIATELGYNDEELRSLGLGAFLHDVGKLTIPKSIIQKPGPLNDNEITCIQKHCELGVRCLKSCHVSKGCLDIVMQHHERLDGSGYPKGLTKDEISRNAKIVMIADVVNAITSYRPYKKSQNMDTAIEILKKDEAKYCQELVSVLQKILK